jgi:hypothetical protein
LNQKQFEKPILNNKKFGQKFLVLPIVKFLIGQELLFVLFLVTLWVKISQIRIKNVSKTSNLLLSFD